jgi:hypothetical protein
MDTTFQSKYEEFCNDLLTACPELKDLIESARALSKEQRVSEYKNKVLKETLSSENHTVLPGVTIPSTIWESLSKNSQKAIKEYNSILNLCVIYESGDVDGIPQEWVDSMMREWRTRMEGVDFTKMSSKFFDMFGKAGDSLPPLPEKFLKGQMAKLAEDLVKEFNPEDFGFTVEDVEACEKDPSRAFEILMKVSGRNPDLIQKAVQKIGKKLQHKVQTGQFKPQDLAREAEELIGEFQSNPAFVEILESFRSVFNFEDMDLARKSGNEGSARLSLVKQRLKKKLEEKKKNKL